MKEPQNQQSCRDLMVNSSIDDINFASENTFSLHRHAYSEYQSDVYYNIIPNKKGVQFSSSILVSHQLSVAA